MKFSKDKLKKELLREAKVQGIQPGSAEILAERVVLATEKWAKTQTMITENDLNRAVAKEAKKYNADLAYVYQNRGKII